MRSEFQRALIIAQKSLAKNIVLFSNGNYLTAGRRQFCSLWTRDFCFAIDGLKAMGRKDVVDSHLELLYANRREDGLVPRVLDNIPPRRRVVYACINSRLHQLLPQIEIKDPLRPEYIDEHGTEAIDSNLLMFPHLSNENEKEEIFNYIDSRAKDQNGFILQPKFSDWQDSAQRKGVSFYTQLLYWRCLKEKNSAFAEVLRNNILSHFHISNFGLYRSLFGRDNISLEAHLLGLEWGFFLDPKVTYDALKRSPLWELAPSNIPGFATFPSYPKQELSWAVRLAGLEEYHGRLHWSWLMAKAAYIAWLMQDLETALYLADHLARILIRDGVVCEVYDSRRNFHPVKTWLYASESPFAWGAAECVRLFKALEKT